MDYKGLPLAVVLTPWSDEALGADVGGWASNYGGVSITATLSTTFPVANRAILIPFELWLPATFLTVATYNGAVVSGNLDIGIYAREGGVALLTRLVSTGSYAQSGTAAIQNKTLAGTQLAAGKYYMALAMDNTTATLYASIAASNPYGWDSVGVKNVDSAFPLPATITSFVASPVSNYIPAFGFSTKTFM